MQVSAINNSTNFGNGYYLDAAKEDIEVAEKISKALRNYEDQFVMIGEDEDAPKKKSPIGVVLSVALGAASIFALTKKGYNSIKNIAIDTKESELFKKLADETVKITKDTKIAQKASEIAKAVSDKFSGNKLVQKAQEITNKVGLDNIAASATAIGATAYVATVDGNGDGIPDIAQKGVNAYKEALKHADAVKSVMDLVA